MKKIVIIDYKTATDETAELVREFDADEDVKRIVLFRSRIPVVCPGVSGKVRLSEDYFRDADYREIDRRTYALVKEWYNTPRAGNGTGITEFLGMQMGSFVEYKLAETLLRIIKDTTALRRILEDWNGAVILCCESPEFRESAIHVCRGRGLAYEERRKPSRSAAHCIYDPAEWSAVGKGAIEVLESLIYLEMPCDGRDRRTLVHDGSRLRARFREAGYRVGEMDLRLDPLGFLKTLLHNLPSLLRARFERNAVRRKASAHFAATWKRLEDDGDFQSVFRYGDLKFWPLVGPYLEDIFLRRFPAIAGAVAYRRVIYEALGVEGIVVSDDAQLIKRIDLKAAQVPSLYVQHGVSGESNGEDILKTDMMATWGEAGREWHVALGNDAAKFTVTGNPRFDRLARYLNAPPKAWRDELTERLHLEDLSGLVVFATQVAPKRSAYDTDDEDEALAWGVCRAVALLPRGRLVIKLHPRQRGREAMYREIADRCGLQGYRIIRDVPLSMLLAHCDLFITESSTAAYEACLWDVPILIVNLTRRGDIVPYVPGGVALGAYAEEDIAPTLRKLLENDESRKRLAANRDRFVERHLYRMDGRATHRVMEALGRMVHAGRVPAGRPGLARAGKADIMRRTSIF
ncbi:MAG: hypothetical protein DRP79_06920 [Planctomycetota bacterium]|nr:MAG: hypothetical protein DRP79_06920 [Planctomycetota bacterium]